MIYAISVDDHQMISLGLEKVFSETNDITLAGFCKSKAELEHFIDSKAYEKTAGGAVPMQNLVALVDIKLEEGSGFDCADFLVSRGETYIQKDLIPDMMYVSGIMVTLTKKEREFLDLISEHLPNEEIAKRLNLSKRTVENYVSRIFDKFNVKNRYELEKLL